jgi:hypothetical protein
MTKAIEARRELLATAAAVRDAEADCTCAPDEVDHECPMHGSYRSAGADLAAATVEYLKAEEAQGLLPIVQLSPDHPIAHAKESDYDHWIGFVCQKIDLAAGYEVDVKARGWGDRGPTRIMADDARRDRIYEAVLTLRDAFLALDSPVVVSVTEPYMGPVTIAIGKEEAERSTCSFCGGQWGVCTCAFDAPDEEGCLPEGARGFDSRDFFVTEPNISVCGRFYVDPVAYYGEAYVEAAKKYGWTIGQKVTGGQS